MRRHTFVHLTAAALVVALGACRDSAGPGTRDGSATTDDVVLQAGVSGEYLFGGQGPARVRCTYSESSHRFECPGVTRGGITVQRSFAFFDAAGASQRAFDPATTAAVNTRASIDGTHAEPGGRLTSEVHLASDMTVSGLAGREAERVLNGTGGGTTTATTVTDRGTIRLTSEIADTTSNLVLPAMGPGAASAARPPFPKSGTIVHVARTTITDPRGATHSTFVREKTTFDGTDTARVEITTELGTRTCTRSLSAPFGLTCA